MKVYHYTATNPAGFRIQGELLAATVDDACAALAQINVVPLRCHAVRSQQGSLYELLFAVLQYLSLSATHADVLPASGSRRYPTRYPTRYQRRFPKITEPQLHQFTADLASLLQAGLPLARALEHLELANGEARISQLAGSLKLAITEGHGFSHALRRLPDAVPGYYASVVEVAETSGRLAEELERLAKQIESRLQFRRRVQRAITYPSLVLLMLVLLVAFLVAVVIPSLAEFMQELDQEMPWHTQTLIGLCDWLLRFTPVCLLLFSLLCVVCLMLRRFNAGFRLLSDQGLLNLPVLGSLLQEWHAARFCHDLASLYRSGIDLLAALKIIDSSSINRYLQANTMIIRRQVEDGVALAGAMRSTGLFPADYLQLMRLAEASGNYADALDQVATLADRRLSKRIEWIERSVGPLMMLVTGLLILWIIVSVIEPIYATAINAGGLL